MMRYSKTLVTTKLRQPTLTDVTYKGEPRSRHAWYAAPWIT